MEPGIAILLCVVALVLGAGVSGFICFKQGISYRKKNSRSCCRLCGKGSGAYR